MALANVTGARGTMLDYLLKARRQPMPIEQTARQLPVRSRGYAGAEAVMREAHV